MDASRAAVGLGQQQMQADEAVPQAGQAGASPEQVCNELSVDHHASLALSCELYAGESYRLALMLDESQPIMSAMNAMCDSSLHTITYVR